MIGAYRLLDKTPIACTFEELAIWRSENPEACCVGLTQIGEWEVSTVFLGIDHSFRDYPPVLFETMIMSVETYEQPTLFGISDMPEFANFQTRCSTWTEALSMHEVACMEVREWVAGAAHLAGVESPVQAE